MTNLRACGWIVQELSQVDKRAADAYVTAGSWGGSVHVFHYVNERTRADQAALVKALLAATQHSIDWTRTQDGPRVVFRGNARLDELGRTFQVFLDVDNRCSR